jgi:hypothetical protein
MVTIIKADWRGSFYFSLHLYAFYSFYEETTAKKKKQNQKPKSDLHEENEQRSERLEALS